MGDYNSPSQCLAGPREVISASSETTWITEPPQLVFNDNLVWYLLIWQGRIKCTFVISESHVVDRKF